MRFAQGGRGERCILGILLATGPGDFAAVGVQRTGAQGQYKAGLGSIDNRYQYRGLVAPFISRTEFRYAVPGQALA